MLNRNTLFFNDCIGLNAPERYYFVDPPPYAPNTVNQTVDYNGYTWKGNPGGGWQQAYPTGQGPVDQQAKIDAATKAYQAGIDTAVGGLKTQGTNLKTQYDSLLSDVLGQGSVAMNTVTGATNAELARRGITNNSYLYGQEMGSAQLPVQKANQAVTGSLGFTEAQLQNELASNIANLQAGGAGTVAQLPLNYGSLQLAQAANLANISLAGSQAAQAGAGARYIPIPGIGLWDTTTNNLVGGITSNNMSTGGYSVLSVK